MKPSLYRFDKLQKTEKELFLIFIKRPITWYKLTTLLWKCALHLVVETGAV